METAQLRRSISKLSTTSLIKKYEEKRFPTQVEMEIAKEFLVKRGYKFPQQSSQTPIKETVKIVTKNTTPKQEVIKEKKVLKKKTFKTEDGKELTKSALTRRLIRQNKTISPSEINKVLLESGFTKAYHSEIQRCRLQSGITKQKK